MNFTIKRSAGKDSISVESNNQVHTFDLSVMSKTEQDEVRKMVVHAWAVDRGFVTEGIAQAA